MLCIIYYVYNTTNYYKKKCTGDVGDLGDIAIIANIAKQKFA